MFPNDGDLIHYRKRYKDLLQAAEKERLIRAAGLRQSGHGRLRRTLAGWLGAQMVKWGRKLQRYSAAPPSYCLQGANDH
jgi:hypothetical protein